ncbi:MAG: choice-of-anchor D domain-containing protein [Thioploca sp.]|nr:choice-of-anchor D domain-containing protein [Thioploca sp.]
MLPEHIEICLIQPRRTPQPITIEALRFRNCRRNFKQIPKLATFLVSLTLILPFAARAATNCETVGEITTVECEALINLYNGTDGEHWYDSPGNNWNVTNEPCSWVGVTCVGGHVTEINRERQGLLGTLPHLGALSYLRVLDLSGCGGWFDELNQDDNLNRIKGSILGSRLPTSLQTLDLSCTNLEGTISDFRSLTGLQVLNLSSNLFRGPIPNPRLHFSTSLRTLDLSSNSGLELGIIPNFKDFTNLQELILFSTNRTGPIEVSSFPTSLRVLYLDNNQLQGNIPDFRPLTRLQNLNLSNNQFSGILSSSNFPTSLQTLDLSSNSGLESQSIPNFNRFSQLQTLNLSNTRRTGSVQGTDFPSRLQWLSLSSNQLNEIADDFSQLNSLSHLELNSNQFSGSLPSLPLPTSLQTLYLAGNQLTGLEPDFSQLKSLSYLDLSQNQFSGSFPGLPLPTSLQTLYLAGNKIDKLENDFSKLSRLSYLNLSQNQLSGSLASPPFPIGLGELYLAGNQLTEIDKNFNRLNKLSYLDLSRNQLTGPLFGSNLPTSLGRLYLNDNQLTGIAAFSQLTRLEYLELSRNQITGLLLGAAFPTSLQELYLNDNQLTKIENDFNRLTKLNYLNVSHNQLSGSLSKATFPTSLETLLLNNNQLTGKLPNLSRLIQLQYLNLSQNQLKGILPDFSQLTQLRTLDLSRNQFSGAIPSTLTSLQQLGSLDLGYNYLTTPYPEVLKFLEAPGNKDPDWSYTQGPQLQCPNGGRVNIQPSPVDFGTEVINSRTAATVYMRSQNCDDIQIQTIEFGGSNIDEFKITSRSCNSGGWQGDSYSSCQFTIEFSPTAAGIKEGASVNLTFTVPNMPIFSMPLQAIAVESGEPQIEMSSNSYDFGEVTLDNSSELQPFTVTNTGNINLKFEKIELTGTATKDFKDYIYSCFTEKVLLPSKQCFINTQFFPTLSAGVKEAKLSITSNAAEKPVEIPLNGTALEPEMCSEDKITIASVGNGSWNSPATWTENKIPLEEDVVQINQGHSVVGIPYAAVKTLCIEAGGILTSADNQGTYLIIQASDYIENKGKIVGQDGTHELAATTLCTTDYWSAIGKESCAQPGAAVYLSVGDWSETRLRNEGTITAGRGGNGKQYSAYGGIVGIYGGGLTNTAINGKRGTILSGSGGHITSKLTGQAGNGGDLSMLAKDYLHHDEVMIFAGDGGNCNPEATESQWGGKGGDIRFNAPFRVDLVGTFGAGTGGIHCQPPENNGQDGQFISDPGIISLSGANTKISGGDIAIYGGKDWVLDLSNLNGFKGPIITATGNITLAVGEGEKSAINLRGSKGLLLQAAGQVNLFSDRILLDDKVELSDIIKANKIVVGPSQILRGVSLAGSGKFFGKPGAILPIRLILSNSGPEKDSYFLEVQDLAGWSLSELSSPIEIYGLNNVLLNLSVQLPTTGGEMNLVKVTATSQIDPKVKAVAEIQIIVAKPNTNAGSILVPKEVPIVVSNGDMTTSPPTTTSTIENNTTIPPITEVTPVDIVQDRTPFDEELPPTSKENITLPPIESEIDNIALAEISAIPTTVITSALPPIPNCPLTGIIDWMCDNHGQVMIDATLESNANVAGGELAGMINNQGIISNVTIQPGTEVHSGQLTGYINNQGLLADFNFVGAFVNNGILSGTITNNTQVGGVFKDVHLAANTQITGGYLQGDILGDVNAPAHLAKLTVKAGSHLSNVILGEDVKLAPGVTFQDVQLVAPLSFTAGNLQGNVTGVNFTNDLMFKDIHLAAHSQLNGVQLQGNILGDINAPALLENVEIKAGSYLTGVILGNGVKLAESVTFGEGVQIASSNSIDSSPLPALGAIATDHQGKIINTVAMLTGGISVNGAPFDAKVITKPSDTVNISGQINPDPRHLGQQAEIVVLITYQSFNAAKNEHSLDLMLDAHGQILPWDGNNAHLAFYQRVVLEANQPVVLYQGSVDVSGSLDISFGYRLENGTMVQNAQPIEMTVIKE